MYIRHMGSEKHEFIRDNGERIVLNDEELEEIADYCSEEMLIDHTIAPKSKMESVDVIFERLKKEISSRTGKRVKTDKDLALHLKVEPAHICRCKKNKTAPFEHIAYLCLDLGLNMSLMIARDDDTEKLF